MRQLKVLFKYGTASNCSETTLHSIRFDLLFSWPDLNKYQKNGELVTQKIKCYLS